MEDRKANIVAALSVSALVIFIIVARLFLKLSKAFFLICGAGITVIIAIFACLMIRHRYNRRRKLLESKFVSEGKELRIEYSFLRKVAGVPTKFRYKELEEATDKFQTVLGQGASASVYKGILSDGTSVAVKRINGDERGDKEFRAEVSAIASVQHVNLVRLIGYCSVPSGSRFLVYDFIPNGSLDCWIFPRRESQSRKNKPCGCLSWDLRHKIAIDVAKALCYLHHDCRSRILHLDVKPENILLDENYRAVVGDFGLSKLVGKDESRIMTTIRGTRGYLAPEWILEHGISEKSDVYSYGMVLFEMIGGRKNVSFVEMDNKSTKKWEYFPKIVNERMREGKIMEIIDQRLLQESGGHNMDEREVKRLVYIAFWCIQERAKLRPTMSLVVEMLEGRVEVEEPPDTQMCIIDLLSIDDETPSGVDNHRQQVARFTIRQVDSDHTSSSSSSSFAMSALSGR